MVCGHVWDEDKDGNGNEIVERRRSLATHQLAPVRFLGVEMQSPERRDPRGGRKKPKKERKKKATHH
jgi:hypothetical protein